MRLQLHRDFTFSDAAALASYVAGMGISHVYCSPILTARAGSIHGYDVIDPGTVNPELGGEQGLRDLVAVLRSHGLGLIVDIVPNHMAVGAADNPWWTDVLRHGQSSRYAKFFDIDWECEDPPCVGRFWPPFWARPMERLSPMATSASRTPPKGRSFVILIPNYPSIRQTMPG